MVSVAVEVGIILLLLVVNGLFAMAELAVVSARKARLQQWADEGDVRAQAALRLAQDPDDFLSTVQVGITLIGILAGAFGGATLSGYLAAVIARAPRLAPYAQEIAFVAVVIVITYLSLVIGELAPKRLALGNAERIAMAAAGPMSVLARAVAPVVRLLTASTDLLLRVFGARSPAGSPVTEEEIKVIIEQGAEAGVLSEAETEVVRNVFRLADRSVGSVMTPRIEIAWLDVDASAEEVCAKIAASGHSRYPVCQTGGALGGDGLDNILGIVEAKALLGCNWRDRPLDLRAVIRPPQFAHETASAVGLLSLFQETSLHCALVVDEYGGVQGIVTLHDVLKAALGDITEPTSEEAPMAVRREDGSWLLDGRLSTGDIRALFGLREDLPGEETGAYETLGGFVMMHLGRIPEVADHFDWLGLRFEVVDMDGRRVDKVLVAAVGE